MKFSINCHKLVKYTCSILKELTLDKTLIFPLCSIASATDRPHARPCQKDASYNAHHAIFQKFATLAETKENRFVVSYSIPMYHFDLDL